MINAPGQHLHADAVAELSHLNRQIDQAYLALARTLADLRDAQAELGGHRMMQLLQANEQLVLEALRLRSDVESSTIALGEATRSVELDPLTRLPNRTLLADRLVQAIAGAKRHEARLALLFLDLDHFKWHNDSLGHAIGDRILVEIGERLTACVRETDTVCRLGGDEFVILLAEVSEPGDPMLVARKMLAAVSSLTHVGQHEVALAASIGIGLYPDDGTDAQTLLDAADAAMYRVKHAGGNGFRFAQAALQQAHAPPDTAPLSAALLHASTRNAMALLRSANEQLVLSALAMSAARETELNLLPAWPGPPWSAHGHASPAQLPFPPPSPSPPSPPRDSSS
ncbi:GGDEF domain-containing protein [Ideonella azotifigens]|uniref:GGDEF domain-containing protein n=1 Tax=Ideonella azotifigens TaxID=513160 RepID=A0ABN1JWW5_9BURK|nr:GGDEF domain-containing protein [Ideonella azotifigens]MCD2341224.1 GGDEF domain-containing protein [Ideonella azotifigens]